MWPNWQPIETAPKDGTRILILTNLGIVTVCWKRNWWEAMIDDYEVQGTNYLVLSPVKYWMPLPPLLQEPHK